MSSTTNSLSRRWALRPLFLSPTWGTVTNSVDVAIDAVRLTLEDAGADSIIGGNGSDVVYGGLGDDVIEGVSVPTRCSEVVEAIPCLTAVLLVE